MVVLEEVDSQFPQQLHLLSLVIISMFLTKALGRQNLFSEKERRGRSKRAKKGRRERKEERGKNVKTGKIKRRRRGGKRGKRERKIMMNTILKTLSTRESNRRMRTTTLSFLFLLRQKMQMIHFRRLYPPKNLVQIPVPGNFSTTGITIAPPIILESTITIPGETAETIVAPTTAGGTF